MCCTAHAGGPDATFIAADKGSSRFFPATAERLVFPKISLRQEASVRYKVRCLPHVIYPSFFSLWVPNEEYIPLQGAPEGAPWRACVIRASLIAPDGRVFFARTIALEKGRRGAEIQGNGSRVSFAFIRDQESRWVPAHLSYDLQVETMEPSLRASDKLVVVAP